LDLTVYAYQFGNRLQLKSARELFTKPIKTDPTFLLFQLDEASYVYLKDFGGAVFINVPKKTRSSIIESLNTEKDHWTNYSKFLIKVEAGSEISVDFDVITIPELRTDLIHIISLNLAQSSVLKHYQALTDEMLEEIKQYSTHLEITGKVNLTRQKLAKYIGKTMSLRNKIAENLYIFEAPPLAWKDAAVADLDTKISVELDFENRYHGMQMGLSVIRENHEFYKDILQHKHSSMLEWIIILLILFEVAQIFIE